MHPLDCSADEKLLKIIISVDSINRFGSHLKVFKQDLNFKFSDFFPVKLSL